MWIKKSEITKLSKEIRSSIDGKSVDFRDNKEGPLSILKNDIHTLVKLKDDQMNSAKEERDNLSSYLADISHQLKTPITSMMIMVDLLENVPPEKQEEFLHNLKQSLSRMEWLTATLLKMAKLDSGAVNFLLEEHETAELVKGAIQPLEVLFDVKNQLLKVGKNQTFSCDKRWTIEALTNLIKNASEHSPENGIIRIDSGTNPIYNWISVTDSGEGMRKERYAALFKRFEYSTNENGYGIGMPLALAIMKGQNGDIDIDFGGNGKGTTFIMKFYK